MKTLKNKVAVVTGASSGIGKGVALELAARGCDLSICSHSRMDALEETKSAIQSMGRRVSAHQVDMGKRQQVDRFSKATLDEFGQVDLVINNAGVGLVVPIEDMDYSDFNWVMQTNFWGMVYGTKAFLPHLKKRPEAAIANISSVWGFWASPLQSAYTSSKFAIRGFTEALGQELAGTGVSVSLIMPGAIRTDIAKNARLKADLGPIKGRDDILRLFDRLARTSPEKAGRAIVNAVVKKKRRVLVGADAHIMDGFNRLFPTMHQRLMPLFL